MTDRSLPGFMACPACKAHLQFLTETEASVAATMAFAAEAVEHEYTPQEAVAGYLKGYHLAGHPADPKAGLLAQETRLAALYGDRQEDARLTCTVLRLRNGRRMVPHSFDLLYADDVDSYCAHGMSDGDFCGLTPGDPIHDPNHPTHTTKDLPHDPGE